jgi:hypothetical protein
MAGSLQFHAMGDLEPRGVDPLILCPRCRTEMRLFAIEPITEYYDDYAFECGGCHRMEVRSVRTPAGEAVFAADKTERAPREAAPVELDDGTGRKLSGVIIGLGSVTAFCAAFLFLVERASTAPMDFIEKYLGFSPDGGDGSLEVFALMLLVTLMTAMGFRFAIR